MSPKKGGRSKRSSLGNQINQYAGNLVIGQDYNTRKTYLESLYSKNKSKKVGEGFLKDKNSKNNKGAPKIRRRRSFARHRNILKGRRGGGGRGRGQQFRFTRIMMKMKIMMRSMGMMMIRIRRLS